MVCSCQSRLGHAVAWEGARRPGPGARRFDLLPGQVNSRSGGLRTEVIGHGGTAVTTSRTVRNLPITLVADVPIRRNLLVSGTDLLHLDV